LSRIAAWLGGVVYGRIYSDDNGRAETDARIITASCRRCIPDDAADAVPLLVHDAAVTCSSLAATRY